MLKETKSDLRFNSEQTAFSSRQSKMLALSHVIKQNKTNSGIEHMISLALDQTYTIFWTQCSETSCPKLFWISILIVNTSK